MRPLTGRVLATLFVGVLFSCIGCKSSKIQIGGDTAVADVVNAGTGGDGQGQAGDGGAGGGGGEVPSADRQLCQGLCSVTAQLPCDSGAAGCVAGCEMSLGDPACGAEARSVAACKFAAGPASYSCVGGLVVLMAGVCQVEMDARRACRAGATAP